jgi:hypothetical protein
MPTEKGVPMTDKEFVIALYPSAHLEMQWGQYQIRKSVIEASPLGYETLSSLHLSEEAAWHFAAIRVRVEERVKAAMEENRALVKDIHPSAFCSRRGNYYHICRPRRGSDSFSLKDYVVLSGHYAAEHFAWQEAARKLRDNAGTSMKQSAGRFGRNQKTSTIAEAM